MFNLLANEKTKNWPLDLAKKNCPQQFLVGGLLNLFCYGWLVIAVWVFLFGTVARAAGSSTASAATAAEISKEASGDQRDRANTGEKKPGDSMDVNKKNLQNTSSKRSSSKIGQIGATKNLLRKKLGPEGGAVYEEADFDSDKIGFIPASRTVSVVAKPFGSYFKFYRVELENGDYGYVATSDFVGENGESNSWDDPEAMAKAKGKKKEIEPVFFARAVGLFYGRVTFKEELQDSIHSEDLSIYGLKITGPDVFFEGPVMDLNFGLHWGAPDYYLPISTNKPTGFLLMADSLIEVPMGTGQNSMLFMGVGPSLTFSHFVYQAGEAKTNSDHSKIGLTFAMGFGYRFTNGLIFRAEGKYLWQNISWNTIQLALQGSF